MKNGEINIWNVIKISGAWLAFVIGASFSTGQSILQKFCPLGSMAYVEIFVALAMYSYMTISFLKLGSEHDFSSNMQIFDYYCGKKIGLIFKGMTIALMFFSPVTMIAGFGATLTQYIDVPTYVGTLLLGTLCLITVLMGLRRMVNIIGVIGPFLILVTLFIGGSSVVMNIDGLQEGLRLANEAELLSFSKNWFVAGMLEASWAPLIIGPFLVSCARQVNTKKEAVYGGILAIAAYGVVLAVMMTAFFCQFEEISQQMVPTLYLAKQISGVLTPIFVVLLSAGIYTSAVPSQFNFCAAFFPEKSIKYNITAVISIFLATIVAMIFPFNVLYNAIYKYFGYASWAFLAFMLLKQFRNLLEKKSVPAEKGDA